MAAPFKRAYTQAARNVPQSRPSHRCPQPTRHWLVPHQRSARSLSSTAYRLADDDKDKAKPAANAAPSDGELDTAPYFDETFYDSLAPVDRDGYRTMTPEERRQMERVKKDLDAEFAPGSPFSHSINRQVQQAVQEINREFRPWEQQRERRADSFWNMGEANDLGPDDEFEENEISSLGHGNLEQHRDFRELMRLASWELPLLSKLSQPFDYTRHKGKNKDVLRWRYTTYLGEHHPASRKVVVEFDPQDVARETGISSSALEKLAGTRYNPQKSMIRMSCESFETQAMNKRALADTIQRLIKEAKSGDFSDIPLDTRHVKKKKKLQFPRAWRMTPERRQELNSKREAFEAPMLESGGTPEQPVEQPVSGINALEAAAGLDVKQEVPIMAEARRAMPNVKTDNRTIGRNL